MKIEIENVEKIYNSDMVEFKALHGINLIIDKGEFVALAGPSGSGKTTLLNLIGTLDSPSAGTIKFEGREITSLEDREKTRLRLEEIGFVFQAYNLINVLSASENVEYVLQLQGIKTSARRKKAIELLGQVGLQGLENRRPDQLSGGQQQRVAVARALASNPGLVLADEPTANLDQQTGLELINLMKKLNDDLGITFVISSHDPMVINRARRRINLLDGKVINDEKV